MSISKTVVFWGILIGNWISLLSQVLPHQEFRVKYYIKHSEYLKNSILAPKSVRNQSLLADFFPVSNPNIYTSTNYESNPMDSQFILTSTFPVFSQYKGFDTIMDITESIQTRPFYIHRREVSNKDYRQFLSDSGSMEFRALNIPYEALLPDTQVWLNSTMYNEAYKDYYFRHPAFDDYPVVGITAIQANAYCQWIGKKISARLPLDFQTHYSIEGDLPTSAEWCATYDICIQKPSYTAIKERFPKSTNIGSINHYSLLTLLGGKQNFIINTYGLTTARGVKVYHFNGSSQFIDDSYGMLNSTNQGGFPSKNWPRIHHFLGNVAEWTSSPALGHLYNNKTWVYNVSGTLVPNAYQNPSVFDLSSYLHTESALQNHYLIKGGSFNQDYYYTEPLAAEFMHKNGASSHVGFRPVIRFYKK
ncbi:MAG: formylglycine-generating enzyme family protein [Bacteroidota bacterium]